MKCYIRKGFISNFSALATLIDNFRARPKHSNGMRIIIVKYETKIMTFINRNTRKLDISSTMRLIYARIV